MDEKTILLKAAFAAVREMEKVAEDGFWTFGSAQNLIFNAVLKSGSIDVTPEDLEAFKSNADA